MKRILTLCTLLLAFSLATSAQVSEQEFQALKALYNATGGDNWKRRSGWENINTTATKDDVTSAWDGLVVAGGHVWSLEFWTNNMSGYLPSEIGDLEWLTDIQIYGNELQGVIPEEIGNLKKLQILRFGANNITSPLPLSIGELEDLSYLEFYNNPLNCDFPNNILYRLNNLRQIEAMDCGLTGQIDDFFDSLPKLEWFVIRNNQLSGEVPPSFSRLTSLVVIDFRNNMFSGSLPDISNNESLYYAYFNNNQFTGSIPGSNYNTKRLKNYYAHQNNLSGTIPNGLFSESLSEYRFDQNFFTFEALEAIAEIVNGRTWVFDTDNRLPLRNKTQSANKGESLILNAVTLSIYNLGGNNNRYKWFRDDVEVYAGNSPSYTVPAASGENAGIYHFEVTNTVVTGITLKSENITVSIIGGNEAPTDILLSADNVNENFNGEVATITALDPDAGDMHTFTLATGNGNNDKDNGKFTIEGNSLRLVSGVNFETTPTLNILLMANDGNGGIFTKAFVITVNDVDEAPEWSSAPNSATIDENVPNGTVVFTFLAIDPEGSEVIYSIHSGDNIGAFTINGDKLVVADNTKLNYDLQNNYTITISASDGNYGAGKRFVIFLNKINRLPVIADAVFTIDENAPVGAIVGTIEASDPDGEAITLSILTGNDAGAFHLNGKNLVVANSAPLNFRTTPQFVLSVNVSDGASNVQATITVKLNQVYFFTGNHLLTFLVPGLTAPAQIDTINRTVTAVVKDVDLAALPVTFTISEGASTAIASGTAFNFSAGPQTIIVTSEAGTAQTWTISVTLQVGTDQFANQVWRIYPNPASHILLVEGVEPGSIVELINANGKIVRTETISNLNTSISLSGIEPGLYLFKLNNGDQSGTNKLIIK